MKITRIKPSLWQAVVGVTCLLWSLGTHAVPQLSVGSMTYDGTSQVINIPINLTNDASVSGIQFDIVYSKGVLNAAAAFKGAGLTTDHQIYTSEIDTKDTTKPGPNFNLKRVQRVVITPPLANSVLSSGEVATIPFIVSSASNVPGNLFEIKNVVMSNDQAGLVTSATCAIAGMIYDANNPNLDSDHDGIPPTLPSCRSEPTRHLRTRIATAWPMVLKLNTI